MNTFHNHQPRSVPSFSAPAAHLCSKSLTKLQGARRAILNEFRQGIASEDRMMQLALTEAEALARQTGFPNLVFPTLAREKVESVAAWNRRQRALRRATLRSFAV